MRSMQDRRRAFLIAAGLLITAALPMRADQPTPAAAARFDAYLDSVEARISRQHGSAENFLALDVSSRTRLRRGEILVERLTPPDRGELPGALLHHWRASAFVPDATAKDLGSLLRDYSRYPAIFSPQVVRSRVFSQRGDDLQVGLRLRQHHAITVVLDTDYNVVFSRLDAEHIASFSRSNRIAEIASPGKRDERPLSQAEDHGFLWRLDTWWSGEQADGGLYLQVESVSLTRSVPTGLKWLIGPYLESVPRESLEFTLRSVCRALRQ